MSGALLLFRKVACWILATAVIATGKARRARKRALRGDVVTAIYFHNPGRKLLAKCVAWLLKHGYTFISVSELVGILRDGRPIPPGAVWLSFDDGYQEWVDTVLPVVRQYKVPVTLFIPPGIISASRRFPWLEGRDDRDATHALSLGELLNIVNLPEVAVGGHTLNHVITTGRTPDELRLEIGPSRKMLQSWTRTAVESMAYPAGSVDGREREIIIDAGFALAATTEPSFITRETDPLLTPRFCVPDQASFAEAICNMVGAWRQVMDPLKRVLNLRCGRETKIVSPGHPDSANASSSEWKTDKRLDFVSDTAAESAGRR